MQNEELSNKTLITTLDSKESFTLEAIQTLFVFCTDPVEKFSKRYNLSPLIVERFVREGKWNELRAQHTERALEVFKVAAIGSTEDALDVEIKLQCLRNAQLEHQANHLAAHLTAYGHLFAVNERTKEMLKDAYGMPIPLRIPIGLKAAHELIQGLELRLEAIAKEARERQTARNKEQAKTLGVDQYKHLLKPSAPAKKNE